MENHIATPLLKRETNLAFSYNSASSFSSTELSCSRVSHFCFNSSHSLERLQDHIILSWPAATIKTTDMALNKAWEASVKIPRMSVIDKLRTKARSSTTTMVTNSFGVLGTRYGIIVGSQKNRVRALDSTPSVKWACLENPSTWLDEISPWILLIGEGYGEVSQTENLTSLVIKCFVSVVIPEIVVTTTYRASTIVGARTAEARIATIAKLYATQLYTSVERP